MIEDLDGNARIAYDTVDIGAYEYDGILIAVPPSLRTTGWTNDTVKLAWDTYVAGTASYEMRYQKTSEPGWSAVVSVFDTARTVSELPADTEYEFQVRAVNDHGKSDWSVIFVTTDPDSGTGILPVIENNVLIIQGTNDADWIEIEETVTQIIVHAFDSTGSTKLKEWAFTRSEIAMIEFSGYGGDDTFIGAYNGVATSIACRLDGGTGNNRLIGGSGNDYIYGGSGNNILDGGYGDNVIIGGYGNNTFYNNSTGSNCFVRVGIGTDNGRNTGDQWADGHHIDTNDGFLILSSTNRQGNYIDYQDVRAYFRDWVETEVFRVVDRISTVYNVIGNYAFLNNPYFDDGAFYCTLVEESNIFVSGLFDGNVTLNLHYDGTRSPTTFLHEVAHAWHTTAGHPFYAPFASISWQSDSRDGDIQPDAQLEDFANDYGMTDPYEDWATTVANVLIGSIPPNASAKYYEKVAIIHQFFTWLNPMPPDPPALQVLLQSPTQIVIGWTNDNRAVDYEIKRSVTGDEAEATLVREGAVKDGNNWTFTLDGEDVIDGETYYFWVRALGYGERAGNSNWTKITAEATANLPVPTQVTATITTTGNRILVSWDGVTNASGYIVQWSSANDFTGTFEFRETNDTSFSIENLTPVTYWIRVIAIGDAENFFDSLPSEVKSVVTVPETPAIEVTTEGIANSATITWTALTDTAYTLQYRAGTSGTWLTWGTTAFAPGTATATVSGLSAGNYQFQLIATGSLTRFSEPSDSKTAQVTAGTSTAAVKPALRAHSKSATINSVTLNWSSKKTMPGATDVYEIKITGGTRKAPIDLGTLNVNVSDLLSTSEICYNGLVLTGNAIGTGVMIAGLKAGTSYTFAITAKNSAGEVLGKKPTNVKAKTAKFTAVQRVQKYANFDMATLSWQPSKALLPAGADVRYEILLYEGTSKTPTKLPASIECVYNERTATLTGLRLISKYKFAIRAIATVDGIEISSLDAKVSVKTRMTW